MGATKTEGLAGHVALVTGALGNLGPVWSSALASAGMTVVGIDIRSPPQDTPVRVEQADVRDRVALRRILELVLHEHEPPSVLVNNAGIDFVPAPGAGGLDEHVFRETLDVNLTGVFNAIEVFGASMQDAGRGSIVNIGSLYASVAPDPSFYDHLDPPFVKPAAYGASKAAVVNLTRYFARLWGPHGVRVNALSPGGVLGAQDDDFKRRFCARVPLGRMAQPADLVGPLLFLASEASSYVNGQELRVDGGFTA
jgi:NAD(P)-dependent dehydrogenase (short-subunit alcohol dehydrogenase family)